MDTKSSFKVEKAEPYYASTGPSHGRVHNSSLKEDVSLLPLPATVTVSRDQVEDLLVQLMLRLNPLRSFIGSHLDQQQLLTLCLHMSAVTLETLKKVPVVSVDENLPPRSPLCNTWKAAVLLQSGLMKRFGTSIQVRKQLVRKDPALLSFIPRHIVETFLAKPEAESDGDQCATLNPTASEEESRLFSQFLPENVKEKMFEQYGSWIRHTKVFQKAFPRIPDKEILEYKRRISKPRLSNRDVVWVDKKYFVADFYEEKNTAARSICSLQQHSVIDNSGHHRLQSGAESLKPILKPCPLQLMASDCNIVKTGQITVGGASVKESTVRCVVVRLLKGRDRNFYRPPNNQKNKVFEKEMVEHIHLLLQKEAKKYKKNRVFLQNLQRLVEDPKQEIRLSREVCRPTRATWMRNKDLLEDAQVALQACNLIATEILNHLKPMVSFAADTKEGDETPYSLNLPIKREAKELRRELTQLELRLQEERFQAREDMSSGGSVAKSVSLTQPQKKTKKKNRFFFLWLSKLVR